MTDIEHYIEERRLTAHQGDEQVGFLSYSLSDTGAWGAHSTVVPKEYGGQGIGSQLVAAFVQDAEREDHEVVATCWFVAEWLERRSANNELAVVDSARSDVLHNRDYWNGMAHEWIEDGESQWETDPNWGIWHAPEVELGLLPEDLGGRQSIELGCGTGYVSSWLAARGAEATGLDISESQLATASRLNDEHNRGVRFVHGDAESLPFPDNSFDFGISEYGAVIWCDPTRWVPEAVRVLRPGSPLVLFGNTPWLLVCTPDDGSAPGERLQRPYFGPKRYDWREVEVDPGGVEFALTVSDWFDLFSRFGLVVERYLEVQAPADAEDKSFVNGRWAHRYPAEHAWVLRLR